MECQCCYEKNEIWECKNCPNITCTKCHEKYVKEFGKTGCFFCNPLEISDQINNNLLTLYRERNEMINTRNSYDYIVPKNIYCTLVSIWVIITFYEIAFNDFFNSNTFSNLLYIIYSVYLGLQTMVYAIESYGLRQINHRINNIRIRLDSRSNII